MKKITALFKTLGIILSIFVITMLLTTGGILAYGLITGKLLGNVQEFLAQVSQNPVAIGFSSILTATVSYLYLIVIKKKKIWAQSSWEKTLLAGILGLSLVFLIVMLDVIFKASISFKGFNLQVIYLLFFFIIQGFGEELLFRSIAYDRLKEAFSPLVSSLIIALCFALAHLANPNMNPIAMVNIALASLVLTYAYEAYGLGGAGLFHALWNYGQIAVFSIPVSGITFAKDGLFSLSNTSMNSGFGLEGSILCLIILLVFLIFITFKNKLAK